MSLEQSIEKLAEAIVLLAQSVGPQAPKATPPGGCCGEGKAAKAEKPAPKAKAPAPKAKEPEEKPFPYSELQAAVLAAVERAGRKDVVAKLKDYGVSVASDIPAEKWKQAAEDFNALGAEDAE